MIKNKETLVNECREIGESESISAELKGLLLSLIYFQKKLI